jgi:hypothetical protein
MQNSQGFPHSGNRIDPKAGIDGAGTDMEYFIGQLIPVPEITKKPSVETFSPDGFLHSPYFTRIH